MAKQRRPIRRRCQHTVQHGVQIQVAACHGEPVRVHRVHGTGRTTATAAWTTPATNGSGDDIVGIGAARRPCVGFVGVAQRPWQGQREDIARKPVPSAQRLQLGLVTCHVRGRCSVVGTIASVR